jgi:DNA-binding NarL/FixJ family response regulator
MTNSERDVQFEIQSLDNLTSYIGNSMLHNLSTERLARTYHPPIKRLYGPAMREQVKVLHANGVRMQLIARKLKMSLSTVYYIAHE